MDWSVGDIISGIFYAMIGYPLVAMIVRAFTAEPIRKHFLNKAFVQLKESHNLEIDHWFALLPGYQARFYLSNHLVLKSKGSPDRLALILEIVPGPNQPPFPCYFSLYRRQEENDAPQSNRPDPYLEINYRSSFIENKVQFVCLLDPDTQSLLARQQVRMEASCLEFAFFDSDFDNHKSLRHLAKVIPTQLDQVRAFLKRLKAAPGLTHFATRLGPDLNALMRRRTLLAWLKEDRRTELAEHWPPPTEPNPTTEQLWLALDMGAHICGETINALANDKPAHFSEVLKLLLPRHPQTRRQELVAALFRLPNRQATVARVLAASPDPAFNESLLACYRQTPDETAFLRALAVAEQPALIPFLCEVVTDGPAPSQRVAAALLAEHGDQRALAVLARTKEIAKKAQRGALENAFQQLQKRLDLPHPSGGMSPATPPGGDLSPVENGASGLDTHAGPD